MKGLSYCQPGIPPVCSPAVATFGQRLREIRTERAKLTQVELAKRLKLSGNSPVSGWENSDGVPEPDVIRDYAQALGVEPWELLVDVETPYDKLRSGGPSLSTPKGTTASLKEGADVPALAKQRKSLRKIEIVLTKALAEIRLRRMDLDSLARERNRKSG